MYNGFAVKCLCRFVNGFTTRNSFRRCIWYIYISMKYTRGISIVFYDVAFLPSLDLQQMSLYLRAFFLYLKLTSSIASSIPCVFCRRWISCYISTSAASHYLKHFNLVPNCNFASEYECSLPGNSGQRAGSYRFFSISGFYFVALNSCR